MAIAFFLIGSAFQQNNHQNPWSSDQVMQPEELVRIIEADKDQHLLILNIGPVDDIKNAVNIGPAEEKYFYKELKKYLKDLDKNQEVVFYCGCCKMETCPNVKPAYELFSKMGFTNFKILDIQENLKVDWINKGYPMK